MTSAKLQQFPQATLGGAHLRVGRGEDENTYEIYVPITQSKNTDFTLTLNFGTEYFCVFRHQNREFQVVGTNVVFSGFQNADGAVERFNITCETEIVDPDSLRKAGEQLPITWADMYENKKYADPPPPRGGGENPPGERKWTGDYCQLLQQSVQSRCVTQIIKNREWNTVANLPSRELVCE